HRCHQHCSDHQRLPGNPPMSPLWERPPAANVSSRLARIARLAARPAAALLILNALSGPAAAQERHSDPVFRAVDSLSIERGFADPPAAARPRVWWHWMNGNVTPEGIRKDLEWMKRIGLGGVQVFEVDVMTPQIVEKRLAFMTSEWK